LSLQEKYFVGFIKRYMTGRLVDKIEEPHTLAKKVIG
jgi:hypothetical protein